MKIFIILFFLIQIPFKVLAKEVGQDFTVSLKFIDTELNTNQLDWKVKVEDEWHEQQKKSYLRVSIQVPENYQLEGVGETRIGGKKWQSFLTGSLEIQKELQLLGNGNQIISKYPFFITLNYLSSGEVLDPSCKGILRVRPITKATYRIRYQCEKAKHGYKVYARGFFERHVVDEELFVDQKKVNFRQLSWLNVKPENSKTSTSVALAFFSMLFFVVI